MRRAIATTLPFLCVAALALALPAVTQARRAYCSPSGDLCYGAFGTGPRVQLRILLFERYFTRYRLCVRGPDRRRDCRRFPIRREAQFYGSSVRWARYFPYRGGGAYRATWDWGGGPVEPAITFRVGRASRCAPSQLRVSRGRGVGSLGHEHWPIRFRNVSARACTLRGYPGVSSVTSRNGVRVGTPADRDPSQPVRRILLAANGGTASALFTQTNVGVFDPTRCRPRTTAGLRVYPPGLTRWFYVPLRHEVCSRGAQGSGSSVRAAVFGTSGL